MFRGIGTRIKCKLTDSRQTQTSHRKRKFKRPVKLTQGSYWTAAPHTSEGAGLENCRGQWGTSCSGFYGNIFKLPAGDAPELKIQAMNRKPELFVLLIVDWLIDSRKRFSGTCHLNVLFWNDWFKFWCYSKKTNPNLHILIVHIN